MAQTKTDPQGAFIFAHQEIVERVNQAMPPEETLFDLAELFKVFGDSTVSYTHLTLPTKRIV